MPIAAQIQFGRAGVGVQHHGLAAIGIAPHDPHQGAVLQSLQPGIKYCGQLPPLGGDVGVGAAVPGEQALRGGHQVGQRQAAVAPAFHMGQQGAGQQDAIGGAGVVGVDKLHPGDVQRAQQALGLPGVQLVAQGQGAVFGGEQVEGVGVVVLHAQASAGAVIRASRASSKALGMGRCCIQVPSSPRINR